MSKFRFSNSNQKECFAKLRFCNHTVLGDCLLVAPHLHSGGNVKAKFCFHSAGGNVMAKVLLLQLYSEGNVIAKFHNSA